MSSIYDQLHRRRTSRHQKSKPAVDHRLKNLVANQICLVDGALLCAAGTLHMRKGMPEAPVAMPHPVLRNTRGFPQLVQVTELVPLDMRHANSVDRVGAMLTTLFDALDTLTQQLPEGEYADAVVTLADGMPIQEQQDIRQRVIDRLNEGQVWDSSTSRCDLRRSDDVSALLRADAELGGMRWVFWLSLDSLIDNVCIQNMEKALHENERCIPGEGAALMLFERLTAEGVPSLGQLWLRTAQHTHDMNAARGAKPRVDALQAMMAPLVESDTPDQWPVPPDWCFMDRGTDRRAVDAFMALQACWPDAFDPATNCLALDQFYGWTGQAVQAMQIMLAAVAMQGEETAMLLTLDKPHVSYLTMLTPVISADTPDTQS